MAFIGDQGDQDQGGGFAGFNPLELARRMAARNQMGMPAPANTVPTATPQPQPQPQSAAAPPGRMLAPQPEPGPGKMAAPQVPGAGPLQQKYQTDAAQGAPELHGIKKVLDIIGQVAAPHIEAAIPGSTGNYNQRIGREAEMAKQEQEGTERQYGIGKTIAETPGSPQRAGEAQTEQDAIAAREQSARDDKTTAPVTPKEPTNDFELWQKQNPNAPVADWMKLQNANKPATAGDTNKVNPIVEAEIGVRPDPKNYPQGANDPKYQADSAAWGKKAEGVQNRMTAVGAQTRGESYGRNRPVQVLDTYNSNRPVTVSAGEAEDNPSRYVTQSGGEKSLPKEALINDIRVSAQSVQKNLSVLGASGFDRAKLAASLADPNGTVESYLQAVPRGSLDDRSQKFVADMFNLREQAMAMRSVLGAGAGSEDMRRAILSTLPSIASNPALGAKQLDNLFQVLNRVEQGVPSVPLSGQGAPGRNEGGGGGGAANDPLGIR